MALKCYFRVDEDEDLTTRYLLRSNAYLKREQWFIELDQFVLFLAERDILLIHLGFENALTLFSLFFLFFRNPRTRRRAPEKEMVYMTLSPFVFRQSNQS
jgi:hypothetical protein